MQKFSKLNESFNLSDEDLVDVFENIIDCGWKITSIETKYMYSIGGANYIQSSLPISQGTSPEVIKLVCLMNDSSKVTIYNCDINMYHKLILGEYDFDLENEILSVIKRLAKYHPKIYRNSSEIVISLHSNSISENILSKYRLAYFNLFNKIKKWEKYDESKVKIYFGDNLIVNPSPTSPDRISNHLMASVDGHNRDGVELLKILLPSISSKNITLKDNSSCEKDPYLESIKNEIQNLGFLIEISWKSVEGKMFYHIKLKYIGDEN